MTELEKLKLMTGGSNENLLSLLLSDATEFVLSYTNRTELPPALSRTVRELAVIAYNRMGTEGESSRSGAGESYSFDTAPKQIYDVLDQYRLIRVGGRAYEVKTEQVETVFPSPAAPNHNNLPPGRKTHIHTPPPRPLACGGVLTCLTKSPIYCIVNQMTLVQPSAKP